VIDFLIDGLRVLSCCPDCSGPEFCEGLLHGRAEAERVISRACFMSGRRVAMEPAVMPNPTSTVLQIAKSVVR
jgi:hypothetical protein